MSFGHVSTAGKDALGIMFSCVGMYTSLLLASIPSTGAINQFFNALVAAAVGVGSVAAAVTIAWQKVVTTGRGIRADLMETRDTVQKNQDVAAQNNARIAVLEKEAVALRERAATAEAKVHIAHKLARQAINQATDEVGTIRAESATTRAEAAAEIAALKKDLAQFHERYHGTVAVVNKLNLESEVREREQIRSNDPDRGAAPGPGPGEPTHVIIDNLEKLANMDSMGSSGGIPVVVVDPKPEDRPKPEARP